MFEKIMTAGKRGNGFQHGYVTRIISEGDEAIPPSRFYLHKTLQNFMITPEQAAEYLRDLKQRRLFARFDGGCCFLNGFLWANQMTDCHWQKNLDLYAWNFGEEWEDDPAIIPWNVHGEQKLMGGRDFWASDALSLASQYEILHREEEHRSRDHIDCPEQFWEHAPQIHGVKKTIMLNI
jgi:hypothetical protein